MLTAKIGCFSQDRDFSLVYDAFPVLAAPAPELFIFLEPCFNEELH